MLSDDEATDKDVSREETKQANVSSLSFGKARIVSTICDGSKVIRTKKIKVKRGKSEEGTSSSSNTSNQNISVVKKDAIKLNASLLELGRQKLKQLEE